MLLKQLADRYTELKPGMQENQAGWMLAILLSNVRHIVLPGLPAGYFERMPGLPPMFPEALAATGPATLPATRPGGDSAGLPLGPSLGGASGEAAGGDTFGPGMDPGRTPPPMPDQPGRTPPPIPGGMPGAAFWRRRRRKPPGAGERGRQRRGLQRGMTGRWIPWRSRAF